MIEPNDHLGKYATVTLTEEDIKKGIHKNFFGGQAALWDLRGSFQLDFLQQMGLSPTAKLLDVGCGPGRAGRFFIEFLDIGNYFGIDYNGDFIKAARMMVDAKALAAKQPGFAVVSNFDPEELASEFDYAMVFSVLNHCKPPQIEAFFDMIPRVVKAGGKVYISHARWYGKTPPKHPGLELTGQFDVGSFDVVRYGWTMEEGPFPIIELTSC